MKALITPPQGIPEALVPIPQQAGDAPRVDGEHAAIAPIPGEVKKDTLDGELDFVKKFIKIYMGVALPRPSGWPEVAENILKIFIDHKLQNGEGISKKYPKIP